MSDEKKFIALCATREEQEQLAEIKKEYAITQDAAMIRFLINQEHKKIFNKNSSVELKPARA